MKNFLFAAALLFVCHSAQAQFFSFGLKGGVNSQVGKPGDITIGSGDTSFNFGVDKARFGTQFGAYFRFGKGVFIQPEIMFNSNRTDYKVGESSVKDVIKNEKYQYLDIPVLLGFNSALCG